MSLGYHGREKRAWHMQLLYVCKYYPHVIHGLLDHVIMYMYMYYASQAQNLPRHLKAHVIVVS